MQTATRRQSAPEPQGMSDARSAALKALASHWPEYLMEAGLLAAFMISACVFTVLLEHPSSAIQQAIENGFVRRVLMGVAMGGTMIAIVYSPWGQRSGAHMNPFVTLTFYSLGKISVWDAVFYSVFQFVGGVTGVWIASVFLGAPLRHSAVNYAATLPGPTGVGVAFAAEMVISFLMITIILTAANSKRFSRFTGVIAGFMVALYITLESPYSGMSMNAARSVGSAYFASDWTAIWIYFTAPLLAMLAGGHLFRLRRGAHSVFCAKLNHHNRKRCIFRCNFGDLHGK